MEVVVLAARGLESDTRVRRKVELCVFTNEDPDGETLGSNVTPWTTPRGMSKNQLARWGKLGQKCSFKFTADPDGEMTQQELDAFLQKASLKISLMASKVPLRNSLLREAKLVLPTSFMDTVTQELDEATANIEAEAVYTIKELVSGDAVGGISTGSWIRLRPAQIGGDNSCTSSPEMWVQVYVMPDHKDKIPQLRQSLEKAVASLDSPEGFDISQSQQPEQAAEAAKDGASASASSGLATEQPPESRVPQLDGGDAAGQPSAQPPSKGTEKKTVMQEVSLIDMGMDDLIDTAKVEQVAAPPVAALPNNGAAAAESNGFAADFANYGQPAPTANSNSNNGSATGLNGLEGLSSLYAQTTLMTEKQLKFASLSDVNGNAPSAAPTSQALVATDPLLAPLKPQPALSNGPSNPAPATGLAMNGQAAAPITVPQPKKDVATMQSLEQSLLAGLSDSLKF